MVVPCERMFRPLPVVPLAIVATLALAAQSAPAFAQYRSHQFGFEAGYLFYGTDASVPVEDHGPLVGLRAGWKLTDQFWLTSRAGFAWRDQVVDVDQTIFILHLVPIAARYYVLTDRFRPFVGVTNSFQFFANGGAGNVFWGPGGSAGLEVRLRRDMFLGFQLDVFHMWGDGEYPVVASTLQLDFFL